MALTRCFPCSIAGLRPTTSSMSYSVTKAGQHGRLHMSCVPSLVVGCTVHLSA